MKCVNCGAEVSTKYCSYCGSMMPTSGSDTVINDNSKTIINNYYVSDNWNNNSDNAYTVSNKKRTSALIWCVLLGYLGAHYFYVGKIGKGILYVFTCGLFGIGWSDLP